ncbi:PAS domain S-box protein [Methanocalculus sp.]|uniref:PAS domain S-box protein n=1 Tax=Methanocalculus sp. TaxID=2004547 RepID=UPI002728CEFB|nr:PAS domain S-box protein [Methanocalculus sp.]MDO8842649.1 PAS domain S-box protein [Methanocalculus sp.]
MPSPISILYVDDEPALLEIGKLFLERMGEFSVTKSESATDAIRLLSDQRFDAIISDYQMPEMNGIELLKYLKTIGNTTPFIIFTGKGREEVAIEALNSGADFYLQKGGDPKSQFAELSNKVRYAVARRRSEDALRESEVRYRNVVEDMDELICRFLPDNTIIFVNDAFCNLFEISREAIIGSRFQPTIHPDDADSVFHHFASFTPDQPSGTIEERVIMPDGQIFWQRWSTRAMYDDSGILREYQSVGRDITNLMMQDRELRRANEELMATDEELRQQYNEIMAAQKELIISEGRYRAIFEYTSAATIIIEEDTTISLANTAFEQLSGDNTEDIIGRSWTEFVSQSDRDRMVQYHQQRRRSNETPPRNYEFTFIDRFGGNHATHVTVGMIPGTRQSVASFYDITDRVLMEDAIRRSEEQYRMITENMTETITVVDLSMHFIYVSPSITALRGFTVSEVMQQSFEEVLIPASRDLALRRFAEEMQHEAEGTHNPDRVVTLDLEEYHKDGSTIWVNNTLKFLRDEDGRPTAILVVSRNITDQKRADIFLKESELFNRTLIENLPDYVLLYGSDGRILHINPPAAAALGYSAQEVIGMHVLSFVAQEYHEGVREKLTDRQEQREIAPYEIEIISKGGERSLVIVKGASIRHHDAPATLLVLTDITDRKKVEDALFRSEEKYRQLIEHSNEGILVAQDGMIRLSNRRLKELTGYSEEEIYAKPFIEFIHPDDREMVAVNHQKRLTGEQVPEHYDFRLLRKDGDYTWITIHSSRSTWDGRYATLNHVIDLTHQKTIEEALRQANRKLQLLSSITRHDILNKLTTLQGYLTLAYDSDDDSIQHTYLRQVEMAAAAIQRHIEFTRQYEKLGVAEPVWQSLSFRLDEISTETITFQDECQALLVLADPMLEKVFFNLMDNTLRHGEGATQVRLSYEIDDNNCRIIWEDNGIGVSDESKKAIFGWGVGKNTGFGLFLSQEILRITGITIQETGTYGKGARFELEVPAGMWRIKS